MPILKNKFGLYFKKGVQLWYEASKGIQRQAIATQRN